MHTGNIDNPSPEAERANEADVRGLFMLALGRAPETDAIIRGFLGQPVAALVRSFFDCAEFRTRLVKPASEGRSPAFDRFKPPSASLLAWARKRLPLSDLTAQGLEGARSWARVYLDLLTDEVFCDTLGRDVAVLQPEIIRAIRVSATLFGALEAVDSNRLRGWALRTDALDLPLAVEVWVNGALVRAAKAELFRRDIQDRFGGKGLAGFEIVLPEDFAEGFQTNVLEIRDRESGHVLAETRIERQMAAPGAVAALRAELSRIGALLTAIDKRLPDLDTGMSTPLEAYGEWVETWRGLPRTGAEVQADAQDRDAGGLGFVVDGCNCQPRWLDDCVSSLIAQKGGHRPTVIVVDKGLLSFAKDLANRASWRGVQIILVESDKRSLAERLLEGVAALPTSVAKVVLARADTVFAADAAGAFSQALEDATEPLAVYADSDVFAADDADRDFRIRRRDTPILRQAFDLDLLSQTPFTGQVVAFRREALTTLGLDIQAEALCVSDALLRLGHGAGRILHLASILTTGQSRIGPDGDVWRRCVEASLTGQTSVQVERHTDILGAQIAGALRVRRAPGSSRATVIIPTRDTLDMLRPCLDSLIARRADNQTEMDILVIDHASQEPETLDYLRALSDAQEIRVMPFEGAFNWALMNNLAAATSDADVMVFLNNDTVVVTPDWLDELTSQALRPEVGVAGARLLYEDGTIQHAGFVTRDADYMFLVHEGVGRPGSDPGYLGRHSLLRSVAAVTGACMAVAGDTFRALGGFDSANLPLEANDVDLCFRARAGGLKILYDPYVTLFHFESKTRGFSFEGERLRVAQAASDLMWARWGEQFGQDPFYNAHFDRGSRPFTRLRPPRSALN